MRRFDVRAIDSGIDQVWSSSLYSGAVITGQVDSSISDITFSTDRVANNRPICKGTFSSILLDGTPGNVTTPELNSFSMSMIVALKTSNLWLIKFTYNSQSIGVRINSDSTIELVWWEDTVEIEPELVLTSRKLVYTEDVSYLLFSKTEKSISMTYNSETVTIAGSDFPVENFSLGDGTGSALIDKVTFTTEKSLPRVEEYFSLFQSSRLDTIPRPTGDSTFNYLLDASSPDQVILDTSDFLADQDYYYSYLLNEKGSGAWKITKRASFEIEWMDATLFPDESWTALTDETEINTFYDRILLRHQNNTDEEFWLDARMTYQVDIPMSYYDVIITGTPHLPADIGRGYFDADPGDFDLATVRMEPLEATQIKSVEILAAFNNTTLDIFETDQGMVTSAVTTGYTLYVNGIERPFSSLKSNQLYHLVIVFDTPIDWIEFNPSLELEFKMVGIGASDVEYAASDAYFIYSMFVGDPLVSIAELITPLSDGVTDSGGAGSVLDLQWNK